MIANQGMAQVFWARVCVFVPPGQVGLLPPSNLDAVGAMPLTCIALGLFWVLTLSNGSPPGSSDPGGGVSFSYRCLNGNAGGGARGKGRVTETAEKVPGKEYQVLVIKYPV